MAGAFEPYKAASDVYSFGLLLWELIHCKIVLGQFDHLQAALLRLQNHTTAQPPFALEAPAAAYVAPPGNLGEASSSPSWFPTDDDGTTTLGGGGYGRYSQSHHTAKTVAGAICMMAPKVLSVALVPAPAAGLGMAPSSAIGNTGTTGSIAMSSVGVRTAACTSDGHPSKLGDCASSMELTSAAPSSATHNRNCQDSSALLEQGFAGMSGATGSGGEGGGVGARGAGEASTAVGSSSASGATCTRLHVAGTSGSALSATSSTCDELRGILAGILSATSVHKGGVAPAAVAPARAPIVCASRMDALSKTLETAPGLVRDASVSTSGSCDDGMSCGAGVGRVGGGWGAGGALMPLVDHAESRDMHRRAPCAVRWVPPQEAGKEASCDVTASSAADGSGRSTVLGHRPAIEAAQWELIVELVCQCWETELEVRPSAANLEARLRESVAAIDTAANGNADGHAEPLWPRVKVD